MKNFINGVVTGTKDFFGISNKSNKLEDINFENRAKDIETDGASKHLDNIIKVFGEEEVPQEIQKRKNTHGRKILEAFLTEAKKKESVIIGEVKKHPGFFNTNTVTDLFYLLLHTVPQEKAPSIKQNSNQQPEESIQAETSLS